MHKKLYSPDTKGIISAPESRKYRQKSTQEERGLKSLDSCKGKSILLNFKSILVPRFFCSHECIPNCPLRNSFNLHLLIVKVNECYLTDLTFVESLNEDMFSCFK